MTSDPTEYMYYKEHNSNLRIMSKMCKKNIYPFLCVKVVYIPKRNNSRNRIRNRKIRETYKIFFHNITKE